MTTSTCPNGHPSTSSDYCDTCGAPMVGTATPEVNIASSASPAPDASETGVTCPSCTLVNIADALFCEGCGYDFTTGTMPRQSTPANSLDLGSGPDNPSVPDPSAAPGSGGVVPAPGAGSGADPGFATAPDPANPSVASGAPLEWVAEVWVDPDWYAEQHSDEPCPSPGLPIVVPLRAQSLLIGRTSRSRNIHPEIECSADIGVSRRQAQLTTDGQRWWVEDLQSANGTYVGAASEALPSDSLPPGQRRELARDDHIYVGAWTCIVVRRATPEEQNGQT